MGRLEAGVEQEYKANLRYNCDRERVYSEYFLCDEKLYYFLIIFFLWKIEIEKITMKINPLNVVVVVEYLSICRKHNDEESATVR